MEVKGRELDYQEKRMILDAIQGGVDSMLKFGFLTAEAAKENAKTLGEKLLHVS